MQRTTSQNSKHLGKKLMQMRELLGIKQDTVAERLGISQQAISRIEQKENVDEATITRAAKALGVSVESIKNLDDKATVYNIVANQGLAGINYESTFNLLEKWIHSLEEIKKLYEELLKSEREKVTLLQKLLGEKY